MKARSSSVLAMIPALLLAAAACTTAPKVDAQPETTLSAGPATVAQQAYKAGEEIAQIGLPGAPTFLGTGFGSLWVAVALDNGGALERIDPATNQVLATIAVGGFPVGIAAGFGSMWQANYLDGTLNRVDPATNTVIATIPVGPGPAQVVAAGGQVWVSNEGSTLTAVDPATNRRASTVHVGRGFKFRALVAGAGSIWTPDIGSGVSRIDPATGAVLGTIRIATCCDGDLLFDHGLLWVGSHTRPDVYRIDPGAGRVMGHLKLGPTPIGLTMAGGRLWVAHGDSGVVTWHAVDSGQELGRHQFTGFVGGAAVTDATSIWFQTLDLGAVVRLAVGSR